jgi:sigma-B regulation protein RsbU (phosphoserine phosphatase)
LSAAREGFPRSTPSATSRSLPRPVALGYRLYIDLKRRLLWRVRRKLIVSYLFIGFVPVLLVIAFFLVSGTLLFLNVSAYVLRNRIATVVDQTQFLAQTAAIEVQRAQNEREVSDTLARRQFAAERRYPMVSYAVVPAPPGCVKSTPRKPLAPAIAGPWSHMAPPKTIPDWVKCADEASLTTSDSEPASLVVRAVAWPEGAPNAVIVDVPVGEGLRRELRDEMGITIGGISTVEGDQNAPRETRRVRILGGSSPRKADPSEPIEWVGFLDYIDWPTGQMNAATVSFRMGLGAVFQYLSGPSLGRVNNLNFGQLLLLLLAVVATLFLIIQVVAFMMGLTLARSITGSVHELFTGTERVRRGDFTHKITIRSRDQLGELAGLVQLDDQQHRGAAATESGEGTPRAGAAASPAASRCRFCRTPRSCFRACRSAGIANPHARSAGTTMTSCLSTTRAWAFSSPTSPARARRPPSTWRSSKASCSR